MNELQRGEQSRHEGQEIIELYARSMQDNQRERPARQDLLKSDSLIHSDDSVEPACGSIEQQAINMPVEPSFAGGHNGMPF